MLSAFAEYLSANKVSLFVPEHIKNAEESNYMFSCTSTMRKVLLSVSSEMTLKVFAIYKPMDLGAASRKPK